MKIETANNILTFDTTDENKLVMLKQLMTRRTGRSTREVDGCVQDLFKTGRCLVRDHHGSRESCQVTFKKLLDRLYAEHRLDFVKSTGEHMVIQDYKYAVDMQNFAVTAWWFGCNGRGEEAVLQEMIEHLEHKSK